MFPPSKRRVKIDLERAVEPGDSRVIRFGAFEVDLSTGELRKSGRPVRLQEQPFRILRHLLERPGEVVTREELRQKIWGDDVYVDFDRSLNTSVARLREALGDSPTRPTYVETVPRKGYRFIAPLDSQVESRGAQMPPTPPQPRGLSGFQVGAIVAAVALATGLAVVYLTSSSPPEPAAATAPAPERLTSYLGVEDEPTFSPDGSHFAFVWNGENQDNHDIYVRSVGGGAASRLTDHPNTDSSPIWSPDGKWIAFRRLLDDESVAVLRVSPFGGREERLLTLPRQGSGRPGGRPMAWAPDSEHLAIIVRDPQANDSSVILVNLSSGVHDTLFNLRNVVRPAFSPDGRYLTYADAGRGCFHLPLTEELKPAGDPMKIDLGQSCSSPVWTPDGEWLVMEVGFKDSPLGLWFARPDGSEARSLHVRVPARGDSRLALGPGGQVAFRQDLTRHAIWRLDLESGEAVPLIESSGRNDFPNYSPNGDKILFWSDRGPEGTWIADADGGNASLLVEGGRDAHWSPDGKRVVFRALEPGNLIRSGPQDVWVIDAQGGPAKNLTSSPSTELFPVWSLDGAWLYLISDGRLSKMPSTGGEPAPFLDGRAAVVDQSPDGRWLYLSRGSSAGTTISRVTAEGEREVLLENVIGFDGAAVTSDGLYYQAGNEDSGYEVRFYRFEDKSSKLVYRMSGRAGPVIDLSSNGRYLLFSERQSAQADLMLMKGAY